MGHQDLPKKKSENFERSIGCVLLNVRLDNSKTTRRRHHCRASLVRSTASEQCVICWDTGNDFCDFLQKTASVNLVTSYDKQRVLRTYSTRHIYETKHYSACSINFEIEVNRTVVSGVGGGGLQDKNEL